MTKNQREITGGVDTHADTHTAAVIDEVGRMLAHREFPADPAGYRALLTWMRGHGRLVQIGIEGTGSYGAGLARYLHAEGVAMVEVDRPDRKARRAHGKSDPIDAQAAALAALSGRAAGTPKTRDGVVEAIRVLRVTRAGAVKAHTATVNTLIGLVRTAPEPLRSQLDPLEGEDLISTAAALRPGPDRRDPTTAAKVALRRLARRCRHLREEIREADADLRELTRLAAPELLTRPGVGPDVSAQLLISAGDNPERLRSEAAFALLCGAAPLPASSGRTDRHRLNRSGDRQANRALHTVALTRMRHHQPTKDYVARRTQEGLSKKEIMRCLKRYIARELYRLIIDALAADPPEPLAMTA